MGGPGSLRMSPASPVAVTGSQAQQGQPRDTRGPGLEESLRLRHNVAHPAWPQSPCSVVQDAKAGKGVIQPGRGLAPGKSFGLRGAISSHFQLSQKRCVSSTHKNTHHTCARTTLQILSSERAHWCVVCTRL